MGTSTSVGSFDLFLAKYAAGLFPKPVFFRPLGTIAYDSANSVTVGTDGSVYVTGVTGGNLDGQINSGKNDAFLIKYNPDGVKQWTKLFGTSANDAASSLAVGSDGAIYVAGTTWGNLDGQINSGGNDVFLIKYKPDGVKQWSKLIGTSGDDTLSGMGTDDLGWIILGGTTSGNLDGQKNTGNKDAFIIKYAPDGVKQWTKLVGTSADDISTALDINKTNGSIYLAGTTDGDLYGQINSNRSTTFFSEFDKDGTQLWTKLFRPPDVISRPGKIRLAGC